MYKCSCCGEKCELISIDESFDYAGTHCTHGQSGTHVQWSEGSDCCEADCDDWDGEDEDEDETPNNCVVIQL